MRRKRLLHPQRNSLTKNLQIKRRKPTMRHNEYTEIADNFCKKHGITVKFTYTGLATNPNWDHCIPCPRYRYDIKTPLGHMWGIFWDSIANKEKLLSKDPKRSLRQNRPPMTSWFALVETSTLAMLTSMNFVRNMDMTTLQVPNARKLGGFGKLVLSRTRSFVGASPKSRSKKCATQFSN